MTGTVTKAKVLRQDFNLYDGQQLTASRRDETGGTLNGLSVGDWVDVLSVYGSGTTYTDAALRQAVRAIGSSRTVGLWLAPGTWDILADLTIGSNFTVGLAPGAILKPASGVTLTISGPLFRHTSTYTSGSGTVTVDGFDSMSSTSAAITYVGADSGSTNAVVCNPSTAVSSYTDGQTFVFYSASANTSATTINISGLGAKTVKKNGGNDDLTAGDIPASAMVAVTYDSTGDVMHLLDAVVPDVQGGASAPTKTKPFMLWPDTTTNLVKIRNSGNSDWVTLGQSGNYGWDLGGLDAQGVLCPHKNLVIKNNTGTPNNQLDIDADNLVVYDTNRVPQILSSVDLTADLTASGANGLDTGAEAVSTWYHAWVIAKQDGTVASLLSTSATAPTLPSGYTYKGYVGAVFNDSGSDFDPLQQKDRNVVNLQTLVLSAGSATSRTSINIGGQVPTTAKAVFGWMKVVDASGGASDRFAVVVPTSVTTDLGAQLVGVFLSALQEIWGSWRTIIIESQTIYYYVNNANTDASVYTTGWEF